MKKRHVFCTIMAVYIFVLLGISPESGAVQKQQSKITASKEQPQMGGTLVFGLARELGNPNPFISTQSTNQFVREASYESLLRQDNAGRIIPSLAEKYEVSAGGTVFILHLHRGVKFHNGKEMKADDVVWSANHVKDERNGAFGNNMIADVKSIEKLNDYTVKFTIAKPSVTFLFKLSNIRMLPIVPANSLQSGQIKIDNNNFVPGTGPFCIESFQPGFGEVIKKFPEYWGTPAYVDRIIFKPITDGANRFNALRTGDVQMADRIAPLDAARAKKGEIKGVKILEAPLGGFQYLVFNNLNPLFQKREMRQALSYATDKKRLIDEALFGAASAADIMMDPKNMWSRVANLPPHKRDLTKAKALLKAAGYNGQDLVLIGRKAALSLYESYQRMLGEAGINIKLEILEAGVMDERVISGKFDLWATGADLNSDPVTTMMPFYYTNKMRKGSYSNVKVDKLLDKLDNEFAEKKRMSLFKELALTVHNDVAAIPLFYEIRYLGMMEKVKGYSPPPGYDYKESGEYFKQVWLK